MVTYIFGKTWRFLENQCNFNSIWGFYNTRHHLLENQPAFYKRITIFIFRFDCFSFSFSFFSLNFRIFPTLSTKKKLNFLEIYVFQCKFAQNCKRKKKYLPKGKVHPNALLLFEGWIFLIGYFGTMCKQRFT